MSGTPLAQRVAVRGRWLSIYRFPTSTYVIGTDDTETALLALGISPETHRWGSTIWGPFVLRRGYFQSASESRPQKSARLGVGFIGTIREIGDPS